MNEVTFAKLDFDSVRETLAGFSATGLGKSLARTLRPSPDVGLVRNWLGQVRELLTVAEVHGLPPMGGIHDIRENVRAAAFPAPLEADALASVAETLAATGVLAAWFAKVGEAVETLRSVRERIHDLTPIAESINEAIDPRGKVRDEASPRLGNLRRTIEQTLGRIRAVFDRMLRHTALTRMLQYAGATFHNDRMVLPLKAEHRGRIPGIVHRTSDSGATLFVEPAESVELNNSLVRLRDEEDKEITHILRLLTQKVNANAPLILDTVRAIGVLDLVSAKCRYAKQRHCVCPEIDETGLLDLHEARHPVLVELFQREAVEGKPPRAVVPIDVRLGDDFDVLVITGPNTGGKTVSIKTVGLLVLMAQCGIPIPVGEGSRMPVFKQVFVDIGDEQSLQQSLSTFSSHLENQLGMLRHSGPRTLVLIDELGAGTDPDEGAAIGRAILTELLNLQAKAIVTTHLSALKAVAFTSPRVDNASVEFDPETLRPTYHLRLGEPGNSNALIIAQRLGMPARLVKAAKGYLDGRTRALDKAIEGTLQSRREAEEARKVAREAGLEARRERDEYEKNREELQRTQKAFEAWTQWINLLRAGDPVFLKTLNRAGRVVRMELHKQKALVSAGAMDIEVPLRDIAPPPPAE